MTVRQISLELIHHWEVQGYHLISDSSIIREDVERAILAYVKQIREEDASTADGWPRWGGYREDIGIDIARAIRAKVPT